ncbi:MAG: hemin uptake protein HemP [Pseudomonadota bacterium]
MDTTKPPIKPDWPRPDVRHVRAIPASELLGAARTVVIEHRGERYELRLTRNEKLILTK